MLKRLLRQRRNKRGRKVFPVSPHRNWSVGRSSGVLASDIRLKQRLCSRMWEDKVRGRSVSNEKSTELSGWALVPIRVAVVARWASKHLSGVCLIAIDSTRWPRMCTKCKQIKGGKPTLYLSPVPSFKKVLPLKNKSLLCTCTNTSAHTIANGNNDIIKNLCCILLVHSTNKRL